MESSTPQSRRFSGRALAILLCSVAAALLVFGGMLLGAGQRALFDSRFFAERAAASLSDPRVNRYVASQITQAVIDRNPDLLLVRPLLQGTAEAIVASTPFQALARRTLLRSHELLATEGGREVLLTVNDVGVLLRSTLVSQPELADKIPADLDAVIGSLKSTRLLDLSSEILRRGRALPVPPAGLFWLGMALVIGAVVLARDRELALVRFGVALALIALVNFLTLDLGGSVLARLPADPALGAAVAGVWDTFAEGFVPGILALGSLGLLLAAAGSASDVVAKRDAIVRRLSAIFLAPTERRALMLLRALVLLAGGSAALLEPTALGRVLVVLAGMVGIYVGLQGLFRVAALTIQPRFKATTVESDGADLGPRPPIPWFAAAVSVVLALAIFLTGHALISKPPEPLVMEVGSDGCNGSPALCDRPLDQVVFAGTHNAMGAADIDGWLFPNQRRTIQRQLADGIRAFTIDVTAGVPVGNMVKTELEEGIGVRAKFEPMLGTEGVDAALRIRSRLVGGNPVDRDLYLCHGLCEIGAIALVPVLKQMRDFLLLHPGEVIILIIEDAVPATEIAEAFAESGLIDLVYRGPVHPPWPTLGEMVRSGERVLVVAENDAAGVPWCHPAFEVFQETPYHVTSPEAFSNEPHRGGTAGSLLLMNHWVTTPPSSLPTNAVQVNTREVLIDRVTALRRERGRIPNVIAVDFYETGDLLEVVDELNRAGGTQAD
jgi:hypothetical protein